MTCTVLAVRGTRITFASYRPPLLDEERLVSPSVVVCDQEGCTNPKRPRGPECRKCYKVLHKRERRAQRRFEERMVPFSQAEYELSRKWYEQWEQEQD